MYTTLAALFFFISTSTTSAGAEPRTSRNEGRARSRATAIRLTGHYRLPPPRQYIVKLSKSIRPPYSPRASLDSFIPVLVGQAGQVILHRRNVTGCLDPTYASVSCSALMPLMYKARFGSHTGARISGKSLAVDVQYFLKCRETAISYQPDCITLAAVLRALRRSISHVACSSSTNRWVVSI